MFRYSARRVSRQMSSFRPLLPPVSSCRKISSNIQIKPLGMGVPTVKGTANLSTTPMKGVAQPLALPRCGFGVGVTSVSHSSFRFSSTNTNTCTPISDASSGAGSGGEGVSADGPAGTSTGGGGSTSSLTGDEEESQGRLKGGGLEGPGPPQRPGKSTSLSKEDKELLRAELNAKAHRPVPDGGVMAAIFTCKVCNTRTSKRFSKQAYEKGIVIVDCPGCNNKHLLADNLGWFEDNAVNIEQMLERRGEEVLRIKGNIHIEFDNDEVTEKKDDSKQLK